MRHENHDVLNVYYAICVWIMWITKADSRAFPETKTTAVYGLWQVQKDRLALLSDNLCSLRGNAQHKFILYIIGALCRLNIKRFFYLDYQLCMLKRFLQKTDSACIEYLMEILFLIISAGYQDLYIRPDSA
jgi:hypothetical protein